MLDKNTPTEAWYKQFWPWFLIFLPLSAVVAGIITLIIAQNNAVTLVSDNYYKDGLAINQNKLLEKNAETLQLVAELLVTSDSKMCTIQLNGQHSDPKQLSLSLIHPTLGNLDQTLVLTKVAKNVYQAPCILPIHGKWYTSISNPRHTWEIKQYAFLPNL